MRQRFRGGLRLLRVPNLFTVPGDPIAGMAVAALVTGQTTIDLHDLFLAGGASLCFYCFGLILNDLHDLEQDRAQSPHRPLPRREVPVALAFLAAIVFVVTGLLLAEFLGKDALLVGSVLAFLVITYNFYAKRHPVIGSITMGLCRGASVLLGVEHTGWLGLPGALALGITVYIAVVTGIARREYGECRHGWRAWAPLGVLLAMSPTLLVLISSADVPLSLRLPTVLALALGWLAVGLIGRRLAQGVSRAEQTRAAVGELIRALIFIQAPYLLLFPATVPFGVALLAGWPIATWLGKRYSGS